MSITISADQHSLMMNDINEKGSEIRKLKKENEKLDSDNKDWEVIARNKTKILQKYLPDYNPLFYPGSDSENIEECFKKYHKEFVKGEYKTMVKESNVEEKIYQLERDNEKLKVAMIKHTQQNYDEWKKETESDAIKLIRLDLERAEEENKKLKEENEKLIETNELESIVKDDDNGNYQDTIDELQLLVEKNTNIVEYLNKEIDKYKKLFGEIKKETEKIKVVKGIVVNDDKTIIAINGVELKIGDKSNVSSVKYTTYTLKEIYAGKTGKYSLRTDEGTIRICNSYITGKKRVYKQ
mgnify:CR=1 FL=1